MSNPEHAPRNEQPKQLAVICADRCTGCEACIEVCPVDCIVKIEQYPEAPGMQAWCEVDWDRCIGCTMCVQIPGKKGDPYELVVCPWEAIEMVPIAGLVEALERIGGPPEMAEQNRRRLLGAARRQLELAQGD